MKRILTYLAAAGLLSAPVLFSDGTATHQNLAKCVDPRGGVMPVAVMPVATYQASGGDVELAGEAPVYHLACGGSGGGGVPGCGPRSPHYHQCK